MTKFNQQGFTLIELMIAITLGLLVVAAALSVFMAGQRSLATQSGLSDLQQTSIFGLTQLTKDVRHTGLNSNASRSVGIGVAGSGIIFDDVAVEGGIHANNVTKTEMATNPIFNGISNDRLTIQFAPHRDEILYSCEGKKLAKGEHNIQTYFVKAIPSTKPTRYGLYCDSANKTEVLDGVGTLLIPDVEAFKVRFGIKNEVSTDVYSMQYKNIGNVKKGDEIVSVELGLLMRSTNNVNAGSVDATRSYTIAGKQTTLKSTANDREYLREAFNQVVAIRNSTGG